MGNNLSMISEVPEFTQITEFLMKSPWLGLLGGTILTCAIQSSAATIAIVQQMYGAGAIGLNIALPFLFGSNIGTTIIVATHDKSLALLANKIYEVKDGKIE